MPTKKKKSHAKQKHGAHVLRIRDYTSLYAFLFLQCLVCVALPGILLLRHIVSDSLGPVSGVFGPGMLLFLTLTVAGIWSVLTEPKTRASWLMVLCIADSVMLYLVFF